MKGLPPAASSLSRYVWSHTHRGRIVTSVVEKAHHIYCYRRGIGEVDCKSSKRIEIGDGMMENDRESESETVSDG